jgi:ABC-type multidrug transport system permease subunit
MATAPKWAPRALQVLSFLLAAGKAAQAVLYLAHGRPVDRWFWTYVVLAFAFLIVGFLSPHLYKRSQ